MRGHDEMHTQAEASLSLQVASLVIGCPALKRSLPVVTNVTHLSSNGGAVAGVYSDKDHRNGVNGERGGE
jgi:hypothetical protein